MNELRVSQVPAVIDTAYQITHASVWTGVDRDYETELQVCDPTGNLIVSKAPSLRSDKDTVVLMISLTGLPLRIAGPYEFSVITADVKTQATILQVSEQRHFMEFG